MGQRVTFIHAADLHLGAPFRGLRGLSEAWATRLLRAIAQSYDRIVKEAIDRKVDFVIIAGDIFDSARASYADFVHFCEGLKRLDAAHIPVYMVTGNHDPYTSWQKDFGALPPNTTMLSAEHPDFRVYERDGEPLCIIAGRGYYNQTWPIDESIAEGLTRTHAEEALAQEWPQVASIPFSVGVIHTGLDLDPIKAPVQPSVLMSSGIDYWALGHIHMRFVGPTSDAPRYVFSGCIQGRDIKETGPRGCYEVTLEQGKANKISFIPTASVVWQQLDVDVSRAVTLTDISEQVMRELFKLNGKAHCEEMCTRITLTGKTSLHEKLARPDVLSDLRKQINDSYVQFFCDALIDKTVAPRDKKALKNEKLFPSVLMSAASRQREAKDETANFLQDEFLKVQMQAPSLKAAQIKQLSAEAEDMVLDLLIQEAQQ